jgi:pimeloyl-ACP methyl ester carboxylesterase
MAGKQGRRLVTTGWWQGSDVQEQLVPVPGGEINVALLGSGPALVLLHGITGSGAAWGTVSAELAREFRLIALDHRGHGRSMKPESGYLLENYAGDLDAVLAHFGLEHPLVMGHSLGGMIALEWAIGQPDRAAALVIEDSPMRYGGEGSAEMFDDWTARSLMPIADAEAFYRDKYPAMSEHEVRRRAANITSTAMGVFTDLKPAMQAYQGASVIDRYAEISSPALLVYGDVAEGGMVPEGDARRFEQVLRSAEIARIQGIGHGVHSDAPEMFLETVLPFLNTHAVNASRVAD